MPVERSSKKTNNTQGPYRRLRRLSSPDVPDFLLPAMLSPAEEHQQEVRRAELNKEVANLGEIAGTWLDCVFSFSYTDFVRSRRPR
jgi:hypothetical protein